MLFNDQFQLIQNMMKGWSDCELTICAYFMMGQVKPFQGRFLVNSFQHGLKKSPGAREIEVCESEANNEEFMRGAMKGAMQYEIGAEFLRKRILLLHAGNEAPKKIFLNILPTFLNRSDLVEEMRETLSYCLIHPAFTQEERKMLDNWVFSLSSSQMKVMDVAAAVAAAAAADSTNQQQQHMDNGHTNGFSHLDWNNVPGLGDSLALTSSTHDSFAVQVPNHQQHMNRAIAASNDQQRKNNSFHNSINSMTSAMRNNCMLSNNSLNSVADNITNSYHTHQQESSYHTQMIQQQQNNGVQQQQQPVVKQNGIGFFADVQVWLKSLRLHKYAELFAEMTYDEMMELTPEKLDEKNVTKGARNKIILSIKRLRDRFGVLKQLEEDINKGEPLRTALLELKNMIHTPIKHYGSNESGIFSSDTGSKNDVIAEDDIPSQYTKVMGKSCTQLLTSKPDEENISMYVRLLDRCIQHPSFTETQKRRLRSWRQQTQKMHRNLSRNMRPLNNSNKNKMRNKFDRGGGNNNVGQQQQNSGSNSLDSSHLCRAPQGMFQQNIQQRPIGRSQFQPHSSNSAPRQMNSQLMSSSSGGLRQMDLSYHQNQMWYNSNGAIQSSSSSLSSIDTRRAASLDPRLGHRMFPGMDDDIPNELNTRLDSLCLSVAEHALSDVAADLKLEDNNKFSSHRLDNNEPDW